MAVTALILLYSQAIVFWATTTMWFVFSTKWFHRAAPIVYTSVGLR